jgi:hypothetical protein
LNNFTPPADTDFGGVVREGYTDAFAQVSFFGRTVIGACRQLPVTP